MSISPLMIARPDEIRAGIIVPSDMALDAELWRWAPDGVSLLFTRTQQVATPVSDDMSDLGGDEGAVRQCIRDLRTAAPAAYAYVSPSGSFVHGLEWQRRLVETMRSVGGAEAVTTPGATLSALTHLGIRRLAIATPHEAGAAESLVTFLAEADVKVVSRARIEFTDDAWAVPYEQTVELVRDANSDEAEAVLVSDTNIATYDVIAPLEAELGKPVLTANQVTLWAMLGAIGRQAVGPHQWLIHGPRLRAARGDH